MKFREFFPVTIFAIAMAFLETAVVIYLREMMYPEGFAFPLAPIIPQLALTEVLREAATMVMLLTIGYISGKNFATRFAWFIYSFAIWDIFYYVFLKVMIDWPESLLTWDILFLIPVTWTGPVITPVIVSISMILLAYVILYFSGRGKEVRIKAIEWAGLGFGYFILFLSFIWDYSAFIIEHYSFSEIFVMPDRTSLFETSVKYIPEQFNWFIFGFGLIVLGWVIVLIFRRLRSSL